MHMPEGLWNSAVGHDDGDLMECLWKKSPEVPVILSAPQTGAGVALDSVVEVREAERIAEEKDWSIVSDDVPISVLGVELESKPADIALRVGCPAFPSDARKAREHRRLLSNLRKNRCLGVLCDVVSRRESSMRPPQPLACILRSGMTSRSKCASFSISQMSWSRAGPRRPAVKIFVLSGTGAPVALVKRSVFDIMNSHFLVRKCYAQNGWLLLTRSEDSILPATIASRSASENSESVLFGDLPLKINDATALYLQEDNFSYRSD